ncbi:hypothetical protein [Mucilaginibacter ginsenosidivorax]|uniref:Bacterial surface antigen (D15) domain-containing protein n=1 Tax=Mucilaginibacter ginsenosidivorax TaxID=862126 RepID=A0A5B8VUY1_9SPHI|nr:hypothetical protein [Mucilaginibacter ginsenosidivorax]QEC75474.1 hypothetical protein FSB76_05760 [Mucilaginibacter ginsenosidivorax]
MKKQLIGTLGLLFSIAGVCNAQKNIHQAYYPVGDDPNIGWFSTMASAKKYETILFEANPIVRYSVFNNIYKLGDRADNHFQAWYLSYRPQLRMYTENSLPVRTPSYRILAGTQQVCRIHDADLLTFSLESGHYSNGQDGGAFTDKYADGSPESEAVYKTITPQTNLSSILNRKSANFSTDLTEFIVNYRRNILAAGPNTDNIAIRTYSYKFGGTFYHDRFFGVFDAGGYSDEDIKIYGKVRLLAGFQYVEKVKWGRWSFTGNLERIFNAHQSVEPWRLETIATAYPIRATPDLGFFVTFIAGHDNYNYRFVDSGHQFGLGISWNLFPPIKLKNVFGQ